MKNKTRIILVVVALIVAAVIAIKAFAENGNAVVSFSGSTINAGENVSMTIGFPNDNAIAVDLYMSYNTDAFTYVSAVDNNGTSRGNQSEEGSVAVFYMDQSEEKNGISSITVTFKAKSDLTEDTSGNISITGASIDFKNNPAITEGNLNQTSATITVKSNTPPPVVESLSVTPQSVIIKVGEESQLESNIGGTTWVSNNEAVATVSGGLVRGVGEGSTEIVATANGNSVTIPVSVSAEETPGDDGPVAPTISPYGNPVIKINEEKQLSTDQDDVTWISSNDDIVTANNGLLKGISSGVALVTVKNSAGKSSTIQVFVYDEADFNGIPDINDIDNQNGGEQNNQNQNGGEQNNQNQNGGEQNNQNQNGGEQNNQNQNGGEQNNQSQNGGEQNNQNQNGGEQNNQSQNGGEQNNQNSNNVSQTGTNQNQGNANGQAQAQNSGSQGQTTQNGNNQGTNQNEITTATANTVAKQGSANSTVEENVPETGESKAETIVLIALITLIVAAILIRSKIKIK